MFCCNHTCHCVNMVSVMSASRYHPCYQSRSSLYIHGLIPRDFVELAEAVPIDSSEPLLLACTYCYYITQHAKKFFGQCDKYSKTCLKWPLKKKTKNWFFKTNYRLMQVKSIAECSFCNTFNLH